MLGAADPELLGAADPELPAAADPELAALPLEAAAPAPCYERVQANAPVWKHFLKDKTSGKVQCNYETGEGAVSH